MIEKVLEVAEGMVGCSAVEVKVTEDVEIKDLSKSQMGHPHGLECQPRRWQHLEQRKL